jgi:hypothetical protein
LTVGNLWFRFGDGKMTQTGGAVDAQNLVLGEGGDAESHSNYFLHAGTFNVSGVANVGKGLGADTLIHSYGSLTISGGTATFNDLQFGIDEQDFVRIVNDGMLNVRQSNYSVSEALADIGANRIVGPLLSVSTTQLAGINYTSIVSLALPGDYNLDGSVDAADYTVWRNTLGSTADFRADGSGNAIVDADDYTLWKENYGSSGTGGVVVQAVPEPTTLTLLVVIAGLCHGALLRARRRVLVGVAAVAMLGPCDIHNANAQVQLADLADLEMSSSGADYRKITIPGTGQLLSHISPSLHQGNADVYPVDPRVTIPGDLRRVGIYWSQFLMGGSDPRDGEYFLTDWVESEGQRVQEFEVLQANGKYIEYQGTWTFRDLFKSTSHHWIWGDGDNMYQRVQTSLEILNPIKNVGAIWTEFFNTPDAFETVAVQTRDDGLQTRTITGTTNSHHLIEYQVGRDDWIAFLNPRNDQAASVARVLLSSESDVRADDEVTPVWADFPLFDNIELHVQRSNLAVSNGDDMAPGTSFFMDNLLITSPNTSSTTWIDSAVERGKVWIELIGPPIAAPATPPSPAGDRFFLPASGAGDWSTSSNWVSGVMPQLYDSVFVGASRTATIDSAVETVRSLTVGDINGGTLRVEPGAKLLVTHRIMIGAGSSAASGSVIQSGGSVGTSGEDPVMFLAFDDDDTASYTISGGELFASTIWFRFGRGTVTQTGGTVGALQLVLGEGGSASSQANYNLQDGLLVVYETANIGKAPGMGAELSNSNGLMNITGGTAVFGDLLFGNIGTNVLQLLGGGELLVSSENYSVAEATAHIASGNLVGTDLLVGQVEIEEHLFTRISTSPMGAGSLSLAKLWNFDAGRAFPVPEPTTAVLSLAVIALATFRRECFTCRDRPSSPHQLW